MPRERAFVVTLAVDEDLEDLDVAEDLTELLEEEFTVLSVNPFGGEAPTLGAGGLPSIPKSPIGFPGFI